MLIHTKSTRTKENKEKEEKTRPCVGDADLEAFRKECLGYVSQYEHQLVADFYNYWTERDTTGRMRWQKQRFWNTEKRLARWVKNQYSSDISAAAVRLNKAQGAPQADSARQRAIAAERERANAEAERQREADKAGAVSYEEWQASKKTTD